MNKAARDWHWRMFCSCDEYNYENPYDGRRNTNIHACPECGRPSDRFILSKGRWNRDWENGNPWAAADWEAWEDPDPTFGTGFAALWRRLFP